MYAPLSLIENIMRKKNTLILLSLGLVVAAGWYITTHYPASQSYSIDTSVKKPDETQGVGAQPDKQDEALPERVNIAMAFTSQAPFGEWSDPRQQDGCEEASVAMIKWWLEGRRSVTKEDAKADILALSAKSEEMFGTFHDTSIADTHKLLKAWVTTGVKSNVEQLTLDGMKQDLADGRVIIIATDGRLLGNPNFSGGGPERHMLIIKGYDDTAHKFIANDVGTRAGADYRYDYDVIMTALIDYNTGYHEPLTSSRKIGIVVEKA